MASGITAQDPELWGPDAEADEDDGGGAMPFALTGTGSVRGGALTIDASASSQSRRGSGAAVASDQRAWDSRFGTATDVSALTAERNIAR
ncbi:hypothetical protein IAE22_30205 [Bacillus sp. S34]|nr:hypothetical protein [Bacillus sp. S34]